MTIFTLYWVVVVSTVDQTLAMGKVRKKKSDRRCKRHSTTLSGLSGRPKLGTINLSTEDDGVAPLPDEMMECSSVVSLTTVGNGRGTDSRRMVVGRVNKIGKRKKRGLKKESWRKSRVYSNVIQ